jgi:hypothetical protein
VLDVCCGDQLLINVMSTSLAALLRWLGTVVGWASFSLVKHVIEMQTKEATLLNKPVSSAVPRTVSRQFPNNYPYIHATTDESVWRDKDVLCDVFVVKR